MMKTKLVGVLIFLLVSTILAAGLVCAAEVPVNLEKVYVDGTGIDVDEDCIVNETGDTVCMQRNSIELLDLEKGDELEIKVRVTAYEDMEDVQVKAAIRGYEYNYKDKTSDTTHVFDVEENTTYSKYLELEVPDKMDNDDYKLWITITDKNDDLKTYGFDLRVSPKRHMLRINDVVFFPEIGVKAGKQFQTSVRVKNVGAKDEESVKVVVSVPELGISGSTYIDMIEADDTESSEDIWLRVPECTEDGFYDAEIMVVYDEGYKEVLETETLAVTGEVCTVGEADDIEDVQDDQIMNISDSTGQTAEKEDMLRKVLEMALIALIIALVIIGVIIGFLKLRGEKEEF